MTRDTWNWGCVLVCLGMATLIALVTMEMVDLSAGAGIFAAWTWVERCQKTLAKRAWKSSRVSKDQVWIVFHCFSVFYRTQQKPFIEKQSLFEAINAIIQETALSRCRTRYCYWSWATPTACQVWLAMSCVRQSKPHNPEHRHWYQGYMKIYRNICDIVTSPRYSW